MQTGNGQRAVEQIGGCQSSSPLVSATCSGPSLVAQSFDPQRPQQSAAGPVVAELAGRKSVRQRQQAVETGLGGDREAGNQQSQQQQDQR